MAVRKDDNTPHVLPSLATRRALAEQTTPELKRQAREYARGRLKLLRWAGIPASKVYPRELVDDAHADTWSGILPWDPSQCSLLEHLRQAIKRRTWLEIRHGRRVSFVPLYEPANDETISEQIVSEDVERVLAEASRGSCSPIVLHAMLARICQGLRLQVVRDHEATAVVQCWEDGCVDRNDVMALTGLTEAAYECTRKRLLYTSRQLPSELREVAQDLLRNVA
jgi:hypothetical protein